MHYLRFGFTPGAGRRFAAGPVRIVVDHPEYQAGSSSREEQRDELARDLALTRRRLRVRACHAVQIRIRRLDPDLPLPAAQHPDDAGYDLYAARRAQLDAGGGRALVPTGIAVAIPSGYAGFVLPRSGLALKHGVTCLNTPGLIDPQYRGELKVLLVNTDPTEPYESTAATASRSS